MAIYTFQCPKCNRQEEIARLMADADKPQKCTNCSVDMNRNYQADLPHAAKDYNRPIHSDSLAISPTQRTEHEKLFPDIKLDKACRPIFDNFKQHDDYLKKTGFVKQPQKIKHKGKRIA